MCDLPPPAELVQLSRSRYIVIIKYISVRVDVSKESAYRIRRDSIDLWNSVQIGGLRHTSSQK